MRPIRSIDAHGLLIASLLAGVSSNPARAIDRLITAILPPPEPKIIPKWEGPNPKKRQRGPWDKGFKG